MSTDTKIREYERKINRLKSRDEIEERSRQQEMKLKKLKQEYREKKYAKPIANIKQIGRNFKVVGKRIQRVGKGLKKADRKKGKNWWQ